jgi:hypothetical protein
MGYASRDKKNLTDVVKIDDKAIEQIKSQLDITAIIEKHLEIKGISLDKIRAEIDAKITKAVVKT